MSAYLSFEGAVEPVVWGDATYTVLPLPADIADALAAQGAKRVEGEIHEHPVNLALSRAPVFDGVFLWAGKSLLDRIDLAPGIVTEVRLRKSDADHVDTPEDVSAALRAQGASAAWEALTSGKQRGLLYQIETAKRPETRSRRIQSLVEALLEEA